MTPVEILLEASTSLLTHGWCQSVSQRDESTCLVQAINMAAYPLLNGGVIALYKAKVALCRAAYNPYTPPSIPHKHWMVLVDTALIVWNDTAGRTQAEVVSAFERAILALDKVTL